MHLYFSAILFSVLQIAPLVFAASIGNETAVKAPLPHTIHSFKKLKGMNCKGDRMCGPQHLRHQRQNPGKGRR
jgi:hypothetical protein